MICQLSSDSAAANTQQSVFMEVHMKSIILITSDRLLEQFLYAHRISFDSQHKRNGKTNWHYSVNARLLDVLHEYFELCQEDESHEDTHRIL